MTWEEHVRGTVLRESALNWYEFREDAVLLEIGYSCRALTGLLCRRVGNVVLVSLGEKEFQEASTQTRDLSNLKILRELPASDRMNFDYIVCMEQVERETDPVDAVRRWMQLLAPGGILILGADNRFGLNYFCGAGEKYTGHPFMGINGYPREWPAQPAEGRLYSRKEWQEILAEAGAVHSRFYYPVPDRTMPQMIFSDHYQDSAGAIERLNDYHYRDPSMVGIEHRLLRDVIDGGALPFMADSFLMEITVDGTLSGIDYAVITTDRGQERGMATTVRRNGRVFKRPLWKAGEAHLRSLEWYTAQLAQKGVPVVPAALHQDSAGLYLDMPFIGCKNLGTVMENALVRDRDFFFRVFDIIRNAVRKSCTPGEGQGSRVFLDLAPWNCFYLEEGDSLEDRLLFYDQEFVLEGTSPEFALYRTIRYYFASSPTARARIPIQDVYLRYGITRAMQADFEKQEEIFIQGIRQTDRFRWLLEASTPDYKAMQEKALRLALPEEGAQSGKPYHIGYVPGVFDLFHTGHLRLIERCKERCDFLIVGVLTDELVAYYKGQPPVVSCEDRMNVIRGLRAADQVIPVDFENTDKLKAWEQLHYDCHFSGDDHTGHWNDVWEELKKRGSNMEFFPYTKGISSTSIKEKMQSRS